MSAAYRAVMRLCQLSRTMHCILFLNRGSAHREVCGGGDEGADERTGDHLVAGVVAQSHAGPAVDDQSDEDDVEQDPVFRLQPVGDLACSGGACGGLAVGDGGGAHAVPIRSLRAARTGIMAVCIRRWLSSARVIARIHSTSA